MRRNAISILSAVAIALGPAIAWADEPSPSNAAPGAECQLGVPGAHGPLGLVHAALEEPIGLSSQQRAAVETSLATLRPPLRDDAALSADRAALAAQIRAGAINETALAFRGPTSEERAAREAAAVAAITTLHDALTAEQRRALVTAILTGHSAGPPPEAREHRYGGPMHMFEGLALTDAQEGAIRAVLESGRPDAATMRARFDVMRAEHEAKLRSFVGSAFDARAFLKPLADAPRLEPGPDRMAHDLAVAIPILTRTQREALAQRIEAEPPRAGGPSET